MGAFRPPADAWSRRDFMRNGSYSIALLCTFGTTAVAQGPEGDDVGRAARRRPSSPFTPVPARPADRARARRRSPPSNGVDVYDVDIKEGLAEILPGFETPIYGYEGIYPGPTIRARKGRPAIVRQHNNLSFDTNVHLHGGYVPAAHDGHPMDVIAARRRVRLHVPERAGRGVPLVPRPRARPHGAHALLRPRRHLPAARRARGGARAARRASTTSRSCSPTTRSTRTARSATPRTSTSASAATRCWSTARSRRGWRCSAGSTGCASSTRPTRAPTTSSWATAARCCRSPPTAGCSSRPSRARASRCTRPSGSRC